MISVDPHLLFHVTANGNLRVLVDGHVHPLLAGFTTMRNALHATAMHLGLEEVKIHLSDHCYFVYNTNEAEPTLVDEGRNDRPESGGQEEFHAMMHLVDKLRAATTNGDMVAAAATFRKTLKEKLLPDFDPKCLDFGHKRIPGPLVKFLTSDFPLLGKLDTSFETKPFGDERLMGQVKRLQKSVQHLPDSADRDELLHLIARLQLGLSDLQAQGTHDWEGVAKVAARRHTPPTPVLPAFNIGGMALGFWPASDHKPMTYTFETVEVGPGFGAAEQFMVTSSNLDKPVPRARGVNRFIFPVDDPAYFDTHTDSNRDFFNLWGGETVNNRVFGKEHLQWLTPKDDNRPQPFNEATQNQIAAIKILEAAQKVAANIEATSANESLIHPYVDPGLKTTRF